MLERRGDTLRMLSRRGNDMLPSFPEIRALKHEIFGQRVPPGAD
jgi:hypothetical protein